MTNDERCLKFQNQLFNPTTALEFISDRWFVGLILVLASFFHPEKTLCVVIYIAPAVSCVEFELSEGEC